MIDLRPNSHSRPKASRVEMEVYLTYDYPTLTLYEDFSNGMARRTKWYVVLKDKEGTTHYIDRGTQEHNLTYSIAGLSALDGHRFTSPFVAAKALDEHLARGGK
jgi:hypothetical protein